MRSINPHPVALGTSALLAAGGALVAREIIPLVVFWLACILPLILWLGIVRQHAKFLFVFLLPIALALAAVWGCLVRAAPGEAVGSDAVGGLQFAAMVVVRLLVLGGIVQTTLLSISPDDFVFTLRKWGLKNGNLLVTAAALALLPELQLRAGQVVTAMYARGVVATRGVVGRLRSFPTVLRPLFAWSLRSALQRAEYWEQRGLITRFAEQSFTKRNVSILWSVLLLVVSASWFAIIVAGCFM